LALDVSLGWGVNASTTFGSTFGVEQKKFREIPSTKNQVISANVDLP